MAGYAGRDAVIVGAVRTPIGKGKAGGALHDARRPSRPQPEGTRRPPASTPSRSTT